jgi:alkaline phosphatase D
VPLPSESRLTILLSLPSRYARRRTLNIAANFVILLFGLEFVLTPYFDTASDVAFTRVGAVYPDSIKISVRYPAAEINATENTVRVLWREKTPEQEVVTEVHTEDNTTETRTETTKIELPWKDGPLLTLTAEDDWVGTANLKGLWPSTKYECKRLLLLKQRVDPKLSLRYPRKFH